MVSALQMGLAMSTSIEPALLTRRNDRRLLLWLLRPPLRLLRAAAAAGIFAGTVIAATPARAQTTTTLVSGDFSLVVSRIDSSGSQIALDDNERAGFFSAARCACPTSYGVSVSLTSDGAAKLTSSDTLDATVMIGSDCDNVSATACPAFGSSLTLNASTTTTGETLMTSDVFTTLAPNASCTALPATSSRLWAIIRLNGNRISTQPSLAISLGGAAPVAPSAVKTQTADSGLLVSWTAPTSTSTIQGYQVFCSPAPSNPPAAAFDTCANATPPPGSGPFASLDPTLLCSDLVSVGTNSVRVKGLQNGTTYQIAVISIGTDGTASPPSDSAEGAPGPTLGFDDIYKEAGGTGMAGCAVGGAPAPGEESAAVVVGLSLAALLLHRRRRWTSALPLALALTTLGTRAAHAEIKDDGGGGGYVPGASATPMGLALDGDPLPARESPRTWNLELRFGPYYPDVDSELADRGQTARPFEQVFGSKQRLRTGLELDRQVSHRGGTWGIGFGIGYYRAKAAALGADHVTRTGDETTFSMVPLSLLAVYRADLLRTRFGSPVIPYAKLGLGCALWSVSDTAKSDSTSGRTFGWNAAAGVSLDLSFLDPEGVRTMDQETGVNQFAIFFEVAHDALHGFGSSSVLRVGDTTWLAGLMLEM